MKRIIAAVLLAAVAVCAHGEPPKPILWKVSDGDNSIFLLGSFHLLTADDYPLSATVTEAFNESELVYFEISPDEMDDQAATQGLIARLGNNEKGATLKSELRPETWVKFQKYAAANQLALSGFQTMKPWLVGMILSVTELQKAGLKQELGLDRHFMELAVSGKKAVKGLETMESQFLVFSQMSTELQDEFLSLTLDESNDSQAMIKKLHTLWRNAEDKALYDTMADEMKQSMPDLYKNLNTNRNLAWLPQLKQFLDDNHHDDALVVVGSMHLLGEDGVVQLLKKAGYDVTRLK